MPTFGRTDTGNLQIGTGNTWKDSSRFEFTGADASDLTTISFYVVTACSVKVALYSDKAGPLPDARLASGPDAVAGGANTWVDVPIDYELDNGAFYWLCAKTSGAAVNIRCQDTINNYKYRAEAYAAAFANPFGATDTDAYELCIHADYDEPAVGGVSKKRMLMGVGLQARTPKFIPRKVVPFKCPLPLYK